MAAAKKKKIKFEGGGLVLFDSVQDAMQAEKVLKGAGYQARLIAPPPELRKGCDLALEVSLVEQPGIERLLDVRDVLYIEVRPLKVDANRISEIVHVTDFGEWIMVKAANMKLTFDKKSGVIVNTSGGGCPDIPVMHAALLEKKVDAAPRPRDIGYTLCALMLDRALEESIAIFKGGK
ncbi:MAG: DUF3343 domain-containing protein [Dehalococcoidales bacterium]|nr:DUF3343 domain-containing protein [Dehalococcoidales bacterium]